MILIMKKEEITKFPKGFFQMERPTITASEAVKDVIPMKWIKKTDSQKNIKKLNRKERAS